VGDEILQGGVGAELGGDMVLVDGGEGIGVRGRCGGGWGGDHDEDMRSRSRGDGKGSVASGMHVTKMAHKAGNARVGGSAGARGSA
jgi:hypothetical protein